MTFNVEEAWLRKEKKGGGREGGREDVWRINIGRLADNEGQNARCKGLR